MNENISNETNEEIEIDLGQLFKLLKKNTKLIVISTVLCAIIGLVFTSFFIDKKYESETRIYLKPKPSATGLVDLNTLNSNSKLVNNYVSIIQGKTLLSKVAEQLELSSVKEVKDSLTIFNEEDTEIINIRAVTDNPVKSKKIAETTVSVFLSQTEKTLDISNMITLDAASVNNIAISPSKKINTVVGAFGGMLLSCGYVFLKFLLDKRLRNRSEAENFLHIPVLGEIPYYEED